MARKSSVLNKQTSSPPSFGQFLVSLRLNSRYPSLDAVIARANEIEGGHALSKALLSVYERDGVKTPKIKTLKLLAAVYGRTYQELAQRWFLDRYQLDSIQPENSRGEEFETFDIPNPNGGKGMTVCSIETLQELEASLPKGSEVGVSAIDFIFDETIFFDVVSKNLSRGIKHHYLIHESGRPSYKSFLSRVAERYPRIAGKLDGNLVRFVPRATLDFPISYVLLLQPSGKVQGFVATPLGQTPFYYQVASQWLSHYLLDTFRWTLSLAFDPEIRTRLAGLQAAAELERMRTEISGFDVYR